MAKDFDGVFVPPGEDPRRHWGFEGERETLAGFLRDRRLTFELKCSGLDTEQMARRAIPPSGLSLLGLLRHLADAERYWFRMVLAGEDVPELRPGDDAFAVDGADDALVALAWEQWRAETDYAERFVADVADMDTMAKAGSRPRTVREILVHLVDEFGRHNGHADLLRELIDGRTGE